MSEKKILIIDKSVELFAKNGFESTSVQDITEACGISKGAFYLHFESKNSLLISIFQLFLDKFTEKVSSALEMEISPKDKLELFLRIQFEETDHYSNFILMLLREQTKPDNNDLFLLMKKMDTQLNDNLSTLLVDIYGEDIKNHLVDMIIMIKGLMKGYSELIVMCDSNFDHSKLARYLLSRIDSLVAGLTTPFLETNFFNKNNPELDCNKS